MNVQMIFLGIGEEKYQKLLKDWNKKHPEKIAVHLDFDEKTAHQVYAASDFFLMPSGFEPCGLSQMIALRYGALPVVHKTGGLADTIVHFDAPDKKGNGFTFEQYDEKALTRCIHQAVAVYKNKRLMSELAEKAFHYNFSWDKSAKEYQKLYQQCLS